MEEIGCGSGGHVYLAMDILLKKRWAIKVFTDIGLHRQEIQILRELEHPMIPRIVEYIEEKGNVCLVMDYLEGADLAALMRNGRTFSKDEVLRFAIEVCEVLEYLHSRQPPVIYRDLKPHNLLLQKNGMLKLVDFGSSCFLETVRVRDAVQAGTKGYAAPEQFGGKSDARTDLYALGVTFDLLYRGKNFGFRAVLRKCRKEKPGRRYGSAVAVRKRLERLRAAGTSGSSIRRLTAAAAVVLVTLALLQNVIHIGSEALYHEKLQKGEYVTAAELYPEREEVYEKILREGINSGRTLHALEQVSALRSLYQEETAPHQHTLFEMGMIWFLGNPMDAEFAADYEKAFEYLSQLPSGRYPEADSGIELLRVLQESRENVDWEQAAKALETMERQTADLADAQKIIQLELLASVWVTNRSYLQKTGADSFGKAEALLEEAMKLSVGVYEREVYVRIQAALTQVYYLDGMLNSDVTLLKKWTELYQILPEHLLPEKLRRENWQRAAYVYEELKAYDVAAGYYRQLIEHYPENTGYYCEYALMELLKRQNVQKALQLYRAAGGLPGAEKHKNYQILKERLEGIE
nr:serine/threonine-protein kinase [Ruminococcus sp. OA3]